MSIYLLLTQRSAWIAVTHRGRDYIIYIITSATIINLSARKLISLLVSFSPMNVENDINSVVQTTGIKIDARVHRLHKQQFFLLPLWTKRIISPITHNSDTLTLLKLIKATLAMLYVNDFVIIPGMPQGSINRKIPKMLSIVSII